MKALSVKQPWAALIASGQKTIETRTWPTKYRGALLICSSAKPENEGGFQCPQCFSFQDKYDIQASVELMGRLAGGETFCKDCGVWVIPTPIQASPSGVMMCVAELVDCRPMTAADEKAACCKVYDGAYSLVLQNVRRVNPVPVKGQLGLFEVSDGLICFPDIHDRGTFGGRLGGTATLDFFGGV